MIIKKIFLIASTLLLLSLKDISAATTVSKTPEDSFKSAAAIYVINRDDIKRSGAISIPEVLRMVPGLQVARGESGQWMVTSRGFANGFANKLLVMVDGRIIYTPLFSGVYWGDQDTMLENIKQIEVVRGPGATQWGANAVNGVINIITEPSANTQGGLVTAAIGNNYGAFATRYGGKIKNNSYYRIFASSHNERDKENFYTKTTGNDFTINRMGFRVDYDEFEKDLITIQGDGYKGDNQLDLFVPYTASASKFNRVKDNLNLYGANFISKWEHQISNKEEVQLQFDYSNSVRDYDFLTRKSQIFNFDFQYSNSLIDSHKITSGLGYRIVDSHLGGKDFRINFDPVNRRNDLLSAFIQDEIALIPDEVFLSIGSKLEHNDFTGYEVQPSVKTSWLLTEDQTLWASIARATRTPNISEYDIKMVMGSVGNIYTRQQGSTGFNSEKLIAYEAGYKIRPTANSLLDITLFYNDYDDLRSAEFSGPTPGNSFFSVYPRNNGQGKAVGFELDGSVKPTKKWELKSAYSYLKLDLDTNPGSTDTELEKEQKRSPRHQFNIGSRYDISKNVTLDNILYYVGPITVTDNYSKTLKIPSYYRFDTHIGWQYSPDISFDLAGQNLFDDSHIEFSGALWSEPVAVGRTIYGKVTLKF